MGLGHGDAGGQHEAAGKGRRHVQTLGNQAVGLVEVGGFLLLGDGAGVHDLPAQLATLELQPGRVLRESPRVG